MGEYSGPVSPVSKFAQISMRDYAMGFAGATEHTPWGEYAIKVKGKTFVFLSAHGKGFSMSVKLPTSRADALDNDFAQPTGYGLGKSGWVTCKFEPGREPPYDLLKQWVQESYDTIASTAKAKGPKRKATKAPAGKRKPAAAKKRRSAAAKPKRKRS